MREVNLSDARAGLAKLIDEVRTTGSAVLLRRHSHSVAVVMGVERYERLRALQDAVRTIELRRALTEPTRDLREAIADLDIL